MKVIKVKMIKYLIMLFSLSTTSSVLASGYSNWAIPTQVELVQGGVLIAGQFGDPHSCGMPNYIFISQTDVKFNHALTLATSALMAGKEMRFYVSACTSVGFHWAGDIINHTQGGQPIYIR